MEVVKKIKDVREKVRVVKGDGRVVGFVPTMGALHEGHLSLVRKARSESDFVVVSIFVNPTQFGPGEDYERYPRDIDRDCKLLEGVGCDLVFAPEASELYSPQFRTRMTVKSLSEVLCGKSRPGHFDGVVLIVAKLFNIVQPDIAFFGQKDAQQAIIIQRMVSDLNFPVRISLHPTVREDDGLAMSSRNTYLTQGERSRATALYRSLKVARDMIENGERDSKIIREKMLEVLEGADIDMDYVEIVSASDLRSVEKVGDGVVLIAVAGRVGKARLIDNIALEISGMDVRETLVEFPEWVEDGQ